MKKIVLFFAAVIVFAACGNNNVKQTSDENLLAQVLVPLSHTPAEAEELIASYNDIEEEALQILEELKDVESNLSEAEWQFVEAYVLLYFEEHIQAFYKNWYGKNVLTKEITEAKEELDKLAVPLSEEQEIYVSTLSAYMVSLKMPVSVKKWIQFRT